MELDDVTLDRYSRQILVEQIGYDGQVRLLQTAVIATGPDPWRSWAVRYLRAAGLRVADLSGAAGPVCLEALTIREEIATEAADLGRIMEDIGYAVCRILRSAVEMEG
ncbi:MAG: hypothetical protein M0Z53_14565 [Thermaerobacter sp.]|nr:hypothetical protein [Thermaerobacter sp.]